jgi:hypothetical protein
MLPTPSDRLHQHVAMLRWALLRRRRLRHAVGLAMRRRDDTASSGTDCQPFRSRSRGFPSEAAGKHYIRVPKSCHSEERGISALRTALLREQGMPLRLGMIRELWHDVGRLCGKAPSPSSDGSRVPSGWRLGGEGNRGNMTAITRIPCQSAALASAGSGKRSLIHACQAGSARATASAASSP